MSPSTEKQCELLRLVVEELTSSGAHDLKLTANPGVSFEGVGDSKQDPHCQPGRKVQVSDWKLLEGECPQTNE